MRKRAFTLIELLVVIAIIAILAAILFPVFATAKAAAKRTASLSNTKQLQLAMLMYGADYDDNMPIAISGWWSRMRAAPNGFGNTTDHPLRPKLWPELTQPYITNYQLFGDPARGDSNGFFNGPPVDYDNDGESDPPRTHRNQNRLAMFGYNYLFLSPFAPVPGSDPLDYCQTSESRSFTQAEDAAATVMMTQSQIFTISETIGYFKSQAPGMWPIIAPHLFYCIFWDGTTGSGNWSRLNSPLKSIEASIYINLKADGSNTSFTDGHSKFMKTASLAAGTNYMIVDKNNGGFWVSGAEIIDRSLYIWNLDDNFFCEDTVTPGCLPGM
ncbi:MAG: prepilin-type N-terminal cleavage/methylation domain-containing protein [Armatimonadetes bacterium]|nr:prepilin-type N-terminal cleavage/methylation domain-containing protein [Armatimonadota bacterium]